MAQSKVTDYFSTTKRVKDGSEVKISILESRGSGVKRKRGAKYDVLYALTPTLSHGEDDTVLSKSHHSVRKKLELPEHEPVATKDDLKPDTDIPKPLTKLTVPADNSQSSNSFTQKPEGNQLERKAKSKGQLNQLKASLKKVEELTRDTQSKVTKQITDTSREKVVKTKQKKEAVSEPVVVPSYERYKDLATKIPPTLILPYKYKTLEDLFKGADTIISILHNRLELCTFTKLKRSLEDMVRRTFERKDLGQIKSVYPDSYKISYEKGLIESGKKDPKYQMIIEANLKGSESEKKVACRKDGRPTFTTSEIMKRKQHFRQQLLKIVKTHHQVFLSKLSPPISVNPDKLNRWHPKFLIDEAPDVPSSELPAPPVSTLPTECQTAQQVLEACRSKIPTRVEQALDKVAAANKLAEKFVGRYSKTGNKEERKVEDGETKSVTCASTSGISSTLLERIRAKEALKAQAAMLRDEEAESQLEMLGRLPDMIKIIRSCFVTEKKTALPEDVVVIKLCDSYKSAVSQGCVEKIISYILEIFPGWMKRVNVTSGTYLRLDREMDLSILSRKIDSLTKQKQYI